MMLIYRILLISLIILAGCLSPDKAAPPRQVGAWVVYWSGESGLAELETHGRLFHQVSLFAYELDGQGSPAYPPGLASLVPRFLALARQQGFQPWVTVVNDVRLGNGTVKLKDVEILKQLLGDVHKRQAHARELAARVKNDGFAGLNLDYEGLRETEREIFIAFLESLVRELHVLNLGFNVVVEPRRGPLPPAGAVSLTVMGYNLHGPSKGPGPRATPDFIAGLGARGRNDAAAAPAIALATGAFAWLPDGKVKKFSWAEALQEAQASRERGRGPQGLTPFARLQDGSELWYEDPQSLEAKWQAARRAGFSSLWLWHLGGNDDQLFKWLAQVRS
jgi:hypothetical protein